MQDIIKEYGPAVVSVVVIASLVVVVKYLVGTNDSSVVGKAFSDLLSYFFTSVTN